jgi:phage shock protein PspC (stress-responsive transcriptional regulator)
MPALRPVYQRHQDALLAGVCAELAQRLGWNVWALRALAVLGLFIHALGTGAIYLVLALILPWGNGDGGDPGLSAPELSDRNQRIADLERRFRDLEREPDQR